MTRAHRNINIAAVLLPFVAFVAAIPMLWNSLVGPLDLILMFAIYAVSTIGITVGYHRLLTHRAFATHKWVEYAYAIMGAVRPAEFYAKAVGAVPIPGSTPGIYAGLLRGGRVPG